MTQMVKDFDWRRPGTFLPVAMAASFKPRAFFAQMENRGDLITPLMFLVWVHLLASLAALVAGFPLSAVAWGLATRLVVDLIFVGLVYTIGHHIMRNPLNAGGFLRVVCYCLGIKLIAVILPFLPAYQDALMVLVYVFFFITLYFGLRAAAGFTFLQSATCVLLSVVGMVLLMSLIGNMTVTVPSQGVAGGGAPSTGAVR
ncbi:hypothetical protein [Desulfoferula mesophila]|uniref:Yip1 domain-containing protein n=1 Tax=Desulfoferula mesophila TaxID=3058419 RepID=A0AAU9ER31_9BACT|nr:hypothetical protein FAK_26450 [Desulfoferula mesophilus]